ncbi:MAG: hypothetical protein ACRDIU_04380 [Actinomycetota bacterium]
MAKSKNAPARKPVKAKGAVRAPKTAPERPPAQWYRRKGFRLVAAIVAAVLLLILIKVGFDARKRANARRDEAQAVQRFDRRVKTLIVPVQEVIETSSKSSGEFTGGIVPKENFSKFTEDWLAAVRKFDSALRNRKIPASLGELEDARALYVQAAVVYLDAIKSYQLAAKLEPPARDDAIKHASNLMAHGQSIVALGDRVVERLKIRYDLVEPQVAVPGQPATDPSVPPIQLPAEEAPPPAPAAPDPAAQITPPAP